MLNDKLKCKNSFFIAAVVLFILLVSSAFASSPGKVYLLEIDGTINPVVADYIESNLENISRKNPQAVIIKMDTPGGLMESMRQIIKAMEKAPFPVIVYVGDAGAHAASAGAFIAMASDITVMAKGTNIGSAHPVRMGEQKVSETIRKKMTEDARAFIKALAEKHSRNAEWAEKAVTESLSITSSEAVELNVVEYEVENFEGLIKVLEGKTITKNKKEWIISFKGGIEKIEMPFFKRFLNHLANPNLAYILLMLGVYGLIYEFSNPGIGFGAALGGVSLLLAALAFQMIPINVAGILLIILGVALMVMDIFVPSFGVLTAGGIISFVMGSLTLIDMKEFPVAISLALILGLAATSALFFIFAAGSGIKIQRKKVTTGQKGMIGLQGDVRKILDPCGMVFVRGELWEAESIGGRLKRGEKVKVVEVKGNLLLVEKEEK